ncbi:hypothetical protein H4R22_000745 [Coemansia sp. RSA 1290]|nr:hypothetical protein LPJ68_002272 [Coemansia sp. RSA 1086]KAJ1751313.1 hypothetical protein LPJ79_002188 [Coemansia sp. RSA 1821]KAJ1873501.1 hypothetical protein LPJ55_002249 [Coemansia sp. RSA 990]KAJ2633109.1 hypothetical protein H4R22_000745 [Coemansia sp. RSA 1290]KAJ2650340.1 hypothetical protein IWW40_002517 [Coemansia sp. RSA 1250]KAJ2675616.1 hypothetical protein IWW42_001038 [Coemansia sp. RSA 1085]
MQALLKHLPRPTRLLGVVPVEPGVVLVGVTLCAWHALQLLQELQSPWAAYRLWMCVSACAGVYAQRKRDWGHAQWFAWTLLADIAVSAADVAWSNELMLSDHEQCMVARQANPTLGHDECLAHIHEIRAIVWALRIVCLGLKVHLALVAHAFEQSMANQNTAPGRNG